MYRCVVKGVRDSSSNLASEVVVATVGYNTTSCVLFPCDACTEVNAAATDQTGRSCKCDVVKMILTLNFS